MRDEIKYYKTAALANQFSLETNKFYICNYNLALIAFCTIFTYILYT